MVNSYHNWSYLPPQLLTTIGDRLDSSIDVLRFRSVCVSWRRSVPPFHRPSPLPSITTPDTDPRFPSTGHIAETSVYRLQPLQNPSSPPNAWLIKVREDPETLQVKLLNPLSENEIEQFPETFPRLLNLHDLRITKICRFFEAKRLQENDGCRDYEPVAPLSLSTGGVVIVRMGIFSLHVLNVNDKSDTWSLLYDLQGSCIFVSIMNFRGKVYALDIQGNCAVVDSELNVTRIDSCMSKDCMDNKYLVESCGELLAVNRLASREDTNGGTIGFRVYRLDEEDCWVPVTNLGNRILFVGRGGSFSVSANDFGCCESNCIFYLGTRDDPVNETYDDDDDEYGSLRGCESWEPEIFNLEDNCVRPLVSSPGCGDIFWPPPSWLSPFTCTSSSVSRGKMDSTEEECQEFIEPPLHSSLDSDNREDIISSLPDSILCHILSKLPTKYAVATSILSSKWRHLFSSIPDPRIDIYDTDGAPDESTPNTHFINSVHHLFNVTLRDVPRFSHLRLHFHHNYVNTTIKALISAASRFQVRHLYLEFTIKGCGISFDDLRNFTSLYAVSLSEDCALYVPSSLGFPNLTILFLHAATFIQSDGLERALNACPLLEHLSLHRCHFPASDVLRISVPNLKLLMIWECYYHDTFDIVIDTPTLELFSYFDTVAEGYSLVDFNCLHRAHIQLGLNDVQFEEEDRSHYYENVAEVIRACYNVKHLYLSSTSVSVSSNVIHPFPIFRNLIELSLGNLNVNGWELLPQLLQNAPNLQELIFEKGIKHHKGCYARFQSCLPESVPTCLSSHLTKVKFENFKGEEDELQLVEYFLKTAVVLIEMKVCLLLSLPIGEMKRIWSSIKALPRRSKKCSLQYM